MADDIRITRDGGRAAPSATEPPIDGRVRVVETHRVETAPAGGVGEPSLGELFKQLAQDSGTLVRQEVALAKAEMRENVAAMARSAALMAVGGVFMLLAAFALTAFLIIALGVALANFWLAALIVGVVYALIGGGLLMAGKNKMQENDLKPEQTIQTLQEDKRWAQAEIEQVKQGLQS